MGGAAGVTFAADPLRQALLEQACADAAQMLDDADAAATATIHAAESRGRALVEQAVAEGVAAAEAAGAHGKAQARRRARSLVLSTQRELYDEVARQAHTAARGLREGAGYAQLLERLSAAARAQLGGDAVLDVDPPELGGVRASNGGRHVDYTLDALVDRCLEQLGTRLERVWA